MGVEEDPTNRRPHGLAVPGAADTFPSMSGLPPPSRAETSPDMLAVHSGLVAALTPAERACRMRDLTLGASMMAMAGLRRRYPGAPEAELLLRLAVLRLGADVVERAYGWRASGRDA